ncbi:junctional adhesion molecule C-like [Anneissia japonica]|uniref:junctional adhesion molecule C-like n=1 Tax=Anneissia japonica TaxID=1529436 RepID=UPI001425A7CE|nr:junctional adhesion molecule C-like [Anneissia japonica]
MYTDDMFQRNIVSCTVVIVFLNVFTCICFAVTVTVNNIGDVVEGSETRIMCNIVRSSSSSTSVLGVSWYNVTNGASDTIAQYQGGTGFVDPSYIDRFSVEGDTTLVIANTSRSDSGTYQCSVVIFDDPPSPASDDVTLTVIYLYQPALSSFITPVMEGDTVEMSCSADANPSPTYAFLSDDEVQQSGSLSTFRIQSVSP